MMNKYIDRREAGIILAQQLKDYARLPNAIILALPRGGVPVAFEIARALSLSMDVFIVRKLGVPNHPELAMGALASGGTVVFNKHIMQELNIDELSINSILQAEQTELERREQLYRGKQPYPALDDKTIILVDDGVATGATIRVAIKTLKKHNPGQIVVAIPVAAHTTYLEISELVDRVVCPIQPPHFNAVSAWYDDFSQTSDNEVIELLSKSQQLQHQKNYVDWARG